MKSEKEKMVRGKPGEYTVSSKLKRGTCVKEEGAISCQMLLMSQVTWGQWYDNLIQLPSVQETHLQSREMEEGLLF